MTREVFLADIYSGEMSRLSNIIRNIKNITQNHAKEKKNQNLLFYLIQNNSKDQLFVSIYM